MKAYWESGGIAPHIFYLSTRWRWVVSFTLRPFYPPENSPWYKLDRRLGRPLRSGWNLLLLSLASQTNLGLGLLHKIRLNFLEASQQWSGCNSKEKNSKPLPRLEPLHHLARSPALHHWSIQAPRIWSSGGLMCIFIFHKRREISCLAELLLTA
jgi:hypothetical protein